MALKKFRPVTPTLRYKTVNSFEELTRSKPEKSLLAGAVNKSGGRNSHGRMTMRRRGGGHKRRYRVIDFKRNKTGVKGKFTFQSTGFRNHNDAWVLRPSPARKALRKWLVEVLESIGSR